MAKRPHSGNATAKTVQIQTATSSAPPSEFGRFKALAAALVAVPKAELNEKLKKS